MFQYFAYFDCIFVILYILYNKCSMNLDYRHADEIITVNGNVLWLGDFQAADDRDWLNSNNIRTGIYALI